MNWEEKAKKIHTDKLEDYINVDIPFAIYDQLPGKYAKQKAKNLIKKWEIEKKLKNLLKK